MSTANFETAWQAYPRKEGKAACIKKWEQKKLDDLGDLIVVHIRKRAKEDKKWKDGFIPMFLTFLNQERWTDEYEVIQYKQPASKANDTKLPEIYPQPCHWQTAANGVLMLVLQASGGVESETLTKLVKMKRQMGDRLRSLYGEHEAPLEDWRRISQEGYAWMLKAARGTSRRTGEEETGASRRESVDDSSEDTGLR